MKNETTTNKKRPKILIVDDEPFNQIILSEILKINNCEVRTVGDGITALQVSEEIKPDLILLDIMMPGIDGYEVCCRLKKNENLCDIPVIFISSLNETKDVVTALRSGGVDYITKPFKAEEVTARVNTHLKLYQQSKEVLELNSRLNKSQEQLKKFAAHLQNIREEERIVLATEIHDKIGQILIALKIDMGLWKKKVLFLSENTQSLEVLENFNDLINIVDNTIKTTRNIISKLKSDQLELLGFIETVKLYCIEFEIINKIDCHFESSITNLSVTEKQKIALFRILQEALTNVSKHANASSVKICLYLQDGNFIMEIIDDGIGIDESQKLLAHSYGVLDMNQRIKTLHGKLTISGIPGNGTCVKIEMPYKS